SSILLVETHTIDPIWISIHRLRPAFQVGQDILGYPLIIGGHVAFGNAVIRIVDLILVCHFNDLTTDFFVYIGAFAFRCRCFVSHNLWLWVLRSVKSHLCSINILTRMYKDPMPVDAVSGQFGGFAVYDQR